MHTSRASITPDGIEYHNARLDQLAPGLFLIARGRYRNQDAERFSRMERVGREADVLSVMQELEPRLRRLSVLVTGGVPMIHGDIGLGQLVPVPMMGEGFGRLLSIVLAIVTSPHGTVLIDEIENGLHHSVLVDVWKAVGVAARQSDVQIFATTHSWECIHAAHQAFESSNTYDFRLHRIEQVDSETQDVAYDREALDAAIEFGLETR